MTKGGGAYEHYCSLAAGGGIESLPFEFLSVIFSGSDLCCPCAHVPCRDGGQPSRDAHRCR